MHTVLYSVPPTLQQATAYPHLHWRLLDTHRQVWVSLVWSLLLSPGSQCTQGSVCAFQEPVSPVLCKFWQLYGGVNGNLLQEGLCHTQVCCTQNPCPCRVEQSTADPYLHRRWSNAVLSQSLWGLWVVVCTRFV